ncbi:MAG: creatininase family protein [Planctomycetales bacterium]|nr:creatininase family protein [Planctomycetales bacterium]
MLLSELSWPAVERLTKDLPVLIPVAAMEQHGHHLPLFTDSLLLGEIVSRVDQGCQQNVLVTPLMWYGNSDHHMDFSGTLSCSPRAYLDLLTSLVNNLLVHGFKRILLLNGHGGNDVPGKQAIFEVRQANRNRQDLLLLFTTYWSLGTQPWVDMPSIVQREMGHACEWETSMILRIRPDLVGDFQRAQTVEPGNAFLPASRAWITKELSAVGHIGSPQLASAEKGEHLFTAFTRDVTSLVNRMNDWDGQSWEG